MIEHVHVIGMGGTGLSAIAKVLLESGYRVSGSDRQYSPLAQSVEAAGAQFYLGHRSENIAGADIVVRSSAVPDDNVEVQAAISQGIAVLKRADFLGRLLAGKEGIAVAGTHGKTTTTAMIAWMLIELGLDPTFIVGGTITGLETNARAGKGQYFVIEADEYDRMFLGLNPKIAVVTNVEHDHPDCYPTPEDFYSAFRDFVARLVPGGSLLACGDHADTAQVLSVAKQNQNPTFTYGISHLQNQYLAEEIRSNPEQGGYQFTLNRDGEKTISLTLQVPGLHNVQNAVAALAVLDLLGLPLPESARALESFRGTGRRFEKVGEAQGVTVISDYAHHPTEIQATLSAARSRYPAREIWAVWQPHTYLRTKLMMKSFADSFQDADHLLVTEVYPARESIDPDFSSKQSVDAIHDPRASYVTSLGEAVDYLSAHLRSGDVLIVMSAGDADQVCTQVLTKLSEAG
ncbi:MAG: UDP-N-acetylmuramate--L-alanine ligase [Anaerolineales bacterium]|nr:UDP-N-acetylmuramate--L-alanine ligase [Anaerolineales bacterium]